MIAAALELAAAGWEVFPCREVNTHPDPKEDNSKSPYTNHGHLDATTDPDQINAWWRRWPKAMIGVRVPNACIVIDIDPRNGGSLEALEAITGALPATLIAWSGRNDGGRHLYFRRPPGRLTSSKLPEGIDLKANGYVIAPPSIHPATGLPYRWEEHPVATPPRGLRELLRPTPCPVNLHRRNGSKGDGLLRTVAAAHKGNRNNALYWAACTAVEDGLIDQIEDELIAAAVSAGETETKARRTVASARKATS